MLFLFDRLLQRPLSDINPHAADRPRAWLRLRHPVRLFHHNFTRFDPFLALRIIPLPPTHQTVALLRHHSLCASLSWASGSFRIHQAVTDWAKKSLTDPQAMFLNAMEKNVRKLVETVKEKY